MRWQLLRYLISGTLAAITHLAILVILVEAAAVREVVASALGFVAACALNYTLQYNWVFRADAAHLRAVSRYVLVTACTLGVNVALFWMLIELAGLWYPLAQVLTIGVVFALNFVANRAFTFGRV